MLHSTSSRNSYSSFYMQWSVFKINKSKLHNTSSGNSQSPFYMQWLVFNPCICLVGSHSTTGAGTKHARSWFRIQCEQQHALHKHGLYHSLSLPNPHSFCATGETDTYFWAVSLPVSTSPAIAAGQEDRQNNKMCHTWAWWEKSLRCSTKL